MYNEIKTLIDSGKNVFITGSAGTGKSYNLNLLRKDFPEMGVTASTGIAAVNVRGTTIHRFAGIGVGKDTAETLYFKMAPQVDERISHCKLLAIDEISMLSAEVMDLINELFKKVRRDNRPFGGIQIIAIGDFLQLPPVSRDDDIKNFAFKGGSWQEAEFQTVLLEKCYRQKDIKFLEALNKIRHGEQIDLMPYANGTYSEKDIHLFALNKLAETFNLNKLREIKKPTRRFVATDYGDPKGYVMLKKYSRVPEELYIKEGARVILLNNIDPEAGLVNGTTGTVREILNDDVTVSFDNGMVIMLTYDKVDSIIEDREEIAFRKQIPLKLAWAITIHKSQGMTLKNVCIDGSKIFECGQAYVAFSRVESPEGLHIKNFNARTIKAHEEAVKFYVAG